MGKTIAQAYTDEGEAIGAIKLAREILIEFAGEHLNPPEAATLVTLNTITDLTRLRRMLKKHATVATWSELLAVD